MWADLPAFAAFEHRDARAGFETVFFHGRRVCGTTTAVEDGVPWAVSYEIELDADGATRTAVVRHRTGAGAGEVRLEAADAGWLVDGVRDPRLDGLQDVDLEASAVTNAFPVRRLRLAVGATAPAPAVYVRALDLGVQRLEQTYTCIAPRRFDYESPEHGFRCELAYDAHGLVREYPGLARRHA